MLDLKLELNPFGSGNGVKQIARIRIANVSREVEGPPDIYVYYIQEPASRFCKEGLDYIGLISGYNRNKPAVHLLYEILNDFKISDLSKIDTSVPDWLRTKLLKYWSD